MGLVADIESAAQAALTLEEATRQHATVVDDLERLCATAQTELAAGVQESEQALAALTTLLGEMDTALGGGFTRLTQTADALDGRVKTLQQSVQTEFDTNHQAIAALLPQVQQALEAVEKGVHEACQGLAKLAQDNDKLVASAEAQADESEARAHQVLASVQAQRQDLERQATALTTSWQTLQDGLDKQLTDLGEAFEETSKASTDNLQNLLEQFATSSQKTHAGVKTSVLEETMQELEKLSADLGQRLADLQHLGDRPREMAENELASLARKLHSVLEPMQTIDRIHQKAKSLELFDF